MSRLILPAYGKWEILVLLLIVLLLIRRKGRVDGQVLILLATLGIVLDVAINYIVAQTGLANLSVPAVLWQFSPPVLGWFLYLGTLWLAKPKYWIIPAIALGISLLTHGLSPIAIVEWIVICVLLAMAARNDIQ